eukprot:2957135-Amphidinium_carterae.1
MATRTSSTDKSTSPNQGFTFAFKSLLVIPRTPNNFMRQYVNMGPECVFEATWSKRPCMT